MKILKILDWKDYIPINRIEEYLKAEKAFCDDMLTLNFSYLNLRSKEVRNYYYAMRQLFLHNYINKYNLTKITIKGN